MKNLKVLMAALIIGGIVQAGWSTAASAQRDPVLKNSPERTPDRQRFDPVTPEQVIRKDKDRVERYRAVPPPKKQGEAEKKKSKPGTPEEQPQPEK